MIKKKSLPKMDYGLLGTVLFLVVFGLLALSSSSSVLSFERFGYNHFYVLRQIMFGAIPGLLLLYFFSRIDYHVWQKFAPLLIGIGIILLAVVLIPGVGFKVGNARRWIDFGYFLFQPSEFVKLALVFYLASWYDKRQHHATDLYYGFLPTLFIVGLISGLIILEPDLGTMVSLAAIAATMFFIGGVKLKYLFSTALAGLGMLWILIKAAPYRVQRITSYFNPEIDTQGISYQINQALLAIGSGGDVGNWFWPIQTKI